jgi:hypothetical protein
VIISHSHKFVFIHTPKTSGSSIGFLLNKYSKNLALPENIDIDTWGWQIPLHQRGMHQPYYLVKNYIPKEYYVFAFVRNPFDLLVSGWRHKYNRDFDSFIMYQLFNSPKLFYKWTQWQYLSFNEKIELDYVGKFENIEKDFNNIAEQIGIKERYNDLPLKNVTNYNKENYKDYYSDETRSIVEKKYAKDLEYWGYKF